MADKKYKLLIMGKNSVLVDVFFTHTQDIFECYTTSCRTDDILNHLKLFTPDAVIYCMNKETQENFAQIVACRQRMVELKIPLVVAGTDMEGEDFNKATNNMANHILPRPFTASLISEKLLRFFDEWEKELEKREQKSQEGLALASRKFVLVIDDDPLILKLIKEQIHEEYEVGTAVSGKVAMKFLEKKTADLILLDFEMPEENGAVVLKKLHENERTKDIPVVFLTGITAKDKVREALAQRPEDYVLKPIEKEKLMDTIKRYIR